MENENGSMSHHEASAGDGKSVSLARRRLLRGGLGAAPVIATFASQPVYAYTCKSASAFTSANNSRPSVTPCNGQGPTWWKTGSWSGTGCGGADQFQAFFGSVPPVSGGYTYPSTVTLMQILTGSLTGETDKLARNMVAALLNVNSGKIGPGVFTAAQLKAIWASTLGGGYVPSPGAAAWNAAGVNTWLGTVFPTT
jgi:hypothetical protein